MQPVQTVVTAPSFRHLALCELLTALQSIHGTFASDTEQAAPSKGQPADFQRTSRASTSSSENATYITARAVTSATTPAKRPASADEVPRRKLTPEISLRCRRPNPVADLRLGFSL